MKKFAVAISALLLSSTAFASWTQEQKSSFSDLLWSPEHASTPAERMNQVIFISCLTKYYEAKYPFEQVMNWWYQPPNPELIQEFMIVNANCKEQLLAQLKTTDI